MELLAPAGNFEKFLTALNFGADAVYLAGQEFGLRAFAGNFSIEEIKKACEIAHSKNKKVYVTVNIIAKDEDFIGLYDYILSLTEAKVDAVIVSDVGIINFIRNNFPSLDVHVSTQANITNAQSAKFFADMGVKRLILARELNIQQISNISKLLKGKVEIECFVHGAMCISYSGRCLLSNYLAGRDANHGECVQACRWKYFIREVNRDEEIEVQEDEKGTYFMNSKDLCMIKHLKELQEAGVTSFKIEGRMKSSYYVACVTNAYRKAIDLLPKQAGEEFIVELEKTSHRRFTTGFYFGDTNTEFRESSMPVQTYEFVGVVKSCVDGMATIEQRNFLQEGDEVEVLSPDSSLLNKTFKISNMKNIDGEKIEKANVAQMLFTSLCPLNLNENDILRKKC